MFSSPARRSAPASTAGFTLIEVLVVLVLIGVIAGLATLSLGNGAERELRKESDRLAVMARELRRTGAKVDEFDDGLVIEDKRSRD